MKRSKHNDESILNDWDMENNTYDAHVFPIKYDMEICEHIIKLLEEIESRKNEISQEHINTLNYMKHYIKSILQQTDKGSVENVSLYDGSFFNVNDLESSHVHHLAMKINEAIHHLNDTIFDNNRRHRIINENINMKNNHTKELLKHNTFLTYCYKCFFIVLISGGVFTLFQIIELFDNSRNHHHNSII